MYVFRFKPRTKRIRNILNLFDSSFQQSSHRVKFSHEFHMPQNSNSVNNQQILQNHNGPGSPNSIQLPIQRSKSLSSADVLARGSAGLGLALGNDATDIGKFPPDVQGLIDKAMNNPNELNARCLMELTHQIMQRAVEGRRYALPMSRLCIAIIAKEIKETFLEALLNTCRQWYQEREKVGIFINLCLIFICKIRFLR